MDATDTTKRTVRVSIFNQSFLLTTDADSPAEELAQEVDDLMSSIARRAGNLDTTRTAILACLHLADRLHTVERQFDALRTGISHKTRDFAMLLDQAVGGVDE
jgi:cell division protein ZapA